VFACVNAPKPKLLGIVNVGPPYALEESGVTLPSPQKKLELLGLTEPSKVPVNEEVKLVVSKVPVPESITSSPSSNKRIVKVDDGATVGVGVGVGVGANGVAVGVDVGVGVGGIGVAVGVGVGVVAGENKIILNNSSINKLYGPELTTPLEMLTFSVIRPKEGW